MATAPVVGRPLASRPPDLQEEPADGFHFPFSNRMTTRMTNWNHQANILHRHHHRRASTVHIIMEEMSITEWTEVKTGVWTSPEPPDPPPPHGRAD
ncbi:UPF0102 protein [Dissostichus eleginoides]|uniref:UPF0102 protein n=1 Tax=Dissostichus eleginoides TaxID=100907 RepID=A0AAD9F3N8_DISEL|nr:UPF0102 protein [Dissostichus eleginoides]